MTQANAGNGFDFISSLLSDQLIEDGAFCHFNSPADGEPLYLPGAKRDDGTMDESKAVGAFVRSTSSKAYDAHIDAVTRKAVSGNRKAKTDAQKQELVLKQLKEEAPQGFAVLVARFQNTSLAGGVWSPSIEEKLALASDPQNKWMVDRVNEFAGNTENYPAIPGNAAAD